jgi:hypothetical protein
MPVRAGIARQERLHFNFHTDFGPMLRLKWLLPLLLATPAAVLAQGAATGSLSQQEIDKVIRDFSEKEKQFKSAWLNYTYSQNLDMQVVSVNGRPSRESLQMESEVVFDDRGRRKVRIIRRNDRLRSLQFTEEDVEVIHNLQPFVLTSDDLPDYKVQFLRKEKIDEINCYVFSVDPKAMRKNRFYFKGQIWVDDQDTQIVMSRGRTVPEPGRQKFPEFETRRELIDKKFWFPTWTEARDLLKFAGGDRIEIHEVVTYDNYRRFDVDATIRYDTKPPK